MDVTEQVASRTAAGGDAPSTAGRVPLGRKILAYVALTKPRVIELLLVTTVPVMILAERGIPNLWLVLGTLVGGALSAGSANAFNCWFDRDIDRLMQRTKGRPLVTGELSSREALAFAWITGVVSTVWLAVLVNWLAAVLAAGAIAFYVLVYTMVLKRRTPQNIVWGGIAGCMPVLIGWAAVTGTLSWEALILFGVVFLWTPPHYWPLSMRYREEYRAAGVPMLAVVRGETVVGLQVVLYAWRPSRARCCSSRSGRWVSCTRSSRSPRARGSSSSRTSYTARRSGTARCGRCASSTARSRTSRSSSSRSASTRSCTSRSDSSSSSSRCGLSRRHAGPRPGESAPQRADGRHPRRVRR